MKTKLFDKNLFLEGIRQLKTVGILQITLLIVSSLTIVFTIVGTSYRHNPEPQEINMFFMNIFIISSFYVFAPIMSLIIFEFTNKRKDSDFYFAIAQKRETLYFSFIGSVMAWSFIAIVFTSLVSLITHLALPSFFIIDYPTILPTLLNAIAGCLLVAAGIGIATSVSGTQLTKLAVAVMLLAFPRTFSTLIIYIVAINNPVVDVKNFGTIFDNNVNVLFGGYKDFYTSYWSVLYTFVLAIIYLVIGVFLFKRRPSEAATQSANSPKLQALIRIVFSLLFCLPSILIIYAGISNNNSDDWHVGAIALYVVAIVAYFLFELITTRKVKNLPKAIPSLGILAVLNVILIVFMVQLNNNINSFNPKPVEIKSISVDLNDLYDSYDYNYSSTDKKNEIIITDRQIINTVSSALNSQLKEQNDIIYQDSWRNLTVEFTTDNTSKYRKIQLNEIEYDNILYYIINKPEYWFEKNLFPEFEKLKNFEVVDYYNNVNLSDEELRTLYAIYKEEYPTIDRKAYFENTIKPSKYIATIRFERDGYDNYHYISQNTPKSLKYYINATKDNDKKNKLIESLKLGATDESEISIKIYSVYNGYVQGDESYYYIGSGKEMDLASFLEGLQESDSTDLILYVENEDYTDKKGYFSSGYYFNITKENLDNLLETMIITKD